MKKLKFFFLWFIAATALPAASSLARELMSFAKTTAGETIQLTLPQTGPNKVFTLGHPDRLVVDVPVLADKPIVSLPSYYRGTLLKAVRYGQFDPTTSRFVFELTRPVNVDGVREEGRTQPRLLIDISAVDPQELAEPAETPVPKKDYAKKDALPPSPPRNSPKTDAPPLIVIDPGHGGVDPGTISPRGVREKDVVFDYAKALKAQLLRTGRYRVKLTREDDRFIMLRKRIAIAREAKADLFISLHADSAPESAARGLSLYTLSEKASDQEAEALAARENKADVLAGMDLSDERQDVADILISLAQRETNNQSAMFGDFLVTSLDDRIRLLPNSHRFAGFAVLKAPDIPSVLIETGFLSHPGEEKLLKSKAHRDKVVDGIVAGVDNYFRYQKVGSK